MDKLKEIEDRLNEGKKLIDRSKSKRKSDKKKRYATHSHNYKGKTKSMPKKQVTIQTSTESIEQAIQDTQIQRERPNTDNEIVIINQRKLNHMT